MRIGITCYPTFGGSGVVATELGIALAKRGDDVHFMNEDELGAMAREVFGADSVRSQFRVPPWACNLALVIKPPLKSTGA